MIDFGELGNLVKTRRSIRKFQDKQVPEEVLLKALELATWAPNGGNQQAWRFYIVTNKELIRQRLQKRNRLFRSSQEPIDLSPEKSRFTTAYPAQQMALFSWHGQESRSSPWVRGTG